LCRDIDALKTAAGYVDKYLENFPSTAGGNNETYFNAFQTAHIKARDFISQSAVGAPDGARIHTVMTGIERLADRIKEQMASSGANYNSTVASCRARIQARLPPTLSCWATSRRQSLLPGSPKEFVLHCESQMRAACSATESRRGLSGLSPY
jgi:hypothetical protein